MDRGYKIRKSRVGAFPTSNEWEYACAAGSRSLFRRGNDTPNFPIPRPDTQESRVWGKHLQQNALICSLRVIPLIGNSVTNKRSFAAEMAVTPGKLEQVHLPPG